MCATARLAVACSLATSLALQAHAQSEPAPEPSTPVADEATPSFRAVARVRAPEREPRAVPERDTRVLRQSLGPSFQLIEALPGSVPVFSGVPYMLVRGAPPAGTLQYYDGMPVPALFHVALGPPITHESLLGAMTFHPAVAPARYGRHTGGVLIAERPASSEAGSELELRLLDAHALTRADSGAAAHARYGYHDLLLDAIGSDAELSYWDYHLQLRHQVAGGSRIDLALLGAGDSLGDRRRPEDDVTLQFHRARVALAQTLRRGEVGSAVYAGYERGVLGQDLTARQLRIGPSAWLELSRPDGTRARLGLDMEARLGEIERTASSSATSFVHPADPGAFLRERGEGLDLQTAPAQIIDRTPLASRPARSVFGAHGELGLSPEDSALTLELGVRADVFVIAGRPEQAFDPRALARWHASQSLALHAAAGTTHQGAVSPVPIPGLADFELDHGLQRSLQLEAGVTLELPAAFTVGMTGFHQEFDDLVYFELVLDCEGNSDPVAPLLFSETGRARVQPVCRRQGLPRGSGRAYGLELLLRRALSERFAGWLGYTLAWADAEADDGTPIVPQADVRHVLNAVLTQSWGAGFHSGVRLHYRSGKAAVNTFFDFARGFTRQYERLPSFFRLDLQLSKSFPLSFGRLVASAELLNVTFSREATKRDCVFDASLDVVCRVDYAPAIVLPNVGLRAEL